MVSIIAGLLRRAANRIDRDRRCGTHSFGPVRQMIRLRDQVVVAVRTCDQCGHSEYVERAKTSREGVE